jgi:hypothetical protein
MLQVAWLRLMLLCLTWPWQQQRASWRLGPAARLMLACHLPCPWVLLQRPSLPALHRQSVGIRVNSSARRQVCWQCRCSIH